jgi:hypothetical protein
MKHQTLDQLQSVADIHIEPLRARMNRSQRLERWAELLERRPNRVLASLPGTEYRPMLERNVMRSDGSPLTVAFEDPVLREEGLRDDSYGEAKRFFELTDRQLHEMVSFCHVGFSLQSSRAAYSVRKAIKDRGFMAALLRALGNYV